MGNQIAFTGSPWTESLNPPWIDWCSCTMTSFDLAGSSTILTTSPTPTLCGSSETCALRHATFRCSRPRAFRIPAGYRLYDQRTLDRLAFIARAKQLGCSLDDITGLTAAWEGGQCGPIQDQLRQLVAGKLTAAHHQISELVTFAAELQQAADEFSDIAFIHAEVYTDDTIETVSPAVQSSGLTYGVITERLDVIFDESELREHLGNLA